MVQDTSAGMFLPGALVPSMQYATHDTGTVLVDSTIADPQIAIDHAAVAIAEANGIPLTIRLHDIPEERFSSAARDGDDMLLPPAIAAQPHDRRERRAVAAVAALAVGVAGSRLDRVYPNETDPALRNRRAPTWQPDAVKDMSAARVAAVRVLAMPEKAGECSAPLVAVMQRIADRANAGPGEPTRQFVPHVVNSPGSFIYPPDRSCLRG